MNLQTFWQESTVAIWTRLKHVLVPIFVGSVVVLCHHFRLRHTRLDRDIKLRLLSLFPFFNDRLFPLCYTNDIFKSFRGLWTWFTLLLWKLLLLNFPLFLTRFDVNLKRSSSILATANITNNGFRPFVHHF